MIHVFYGRSYFSDLWVLLIYMNIADQSGPHQTSPLLFPGGSVLEPTGCWRHWKSLNNFWPKEKIQWTHLRERWLPTKDGNASELMSGLASVSSMKMFTKMYLCSYRSLQLIQQLISHDCITSCKWTIGQVRD